MKKKLSRREFIEMGCLAGAGVLTTAMTGCSPKQFRTEPNAQFLGLPPVKNGTAGLCITDKSNIPELLKTFLPKVVDFSFLAPGDSVFIKVACNSDNDHPAVTNPEAVTFLVDYLKGMGAGEIFVGDQSGVETVRLTAEKRVSSTQHLMKQNGLHQAITDSAATLHCFDDQGWDGYFLDNPDFKSCWQQGVYLPNIINQVDHIIYLPRLGTHALAGYTCAIKNAVGWLRDDSRMELHQQAGTFFEKFAEINHFPAIRNKLRFSLTIAESALLNIGPDIGSTHDFDGTLLLAAENLVDHDVIAAQLLRWFDTQDTSILDMISTYPNQANYWNKWLVKRTWGKPAIENYDPINPFNLDKNIAHDSCLSHLGWLKGYRPKQIRVKTPDNNLPEDMKTWLVEKSNGVILV